MEGESAERETIERAVTFLNVGSLES